MPDEGRYRAAPARAKRAHEERMQRGELASAVGQVRDAQRNLDGLVAGVEVAREQLAQAARVRDEQRTAAARVLAERFAARCRRELAAAVDAAARAQNVLFDRDTAVDAARQALARVRAEREVIERHFARWREAQRRLVERRSD